MFTVKWAKKGHGIVRILTLIIVIACLCIHFPFFEIEVTYHCFTTLLMSTFVMLFYFVIAYTVDDAAGNVQLTEASFLIIKGLCHLLFGSSLIYTLQCVNEVLWHKMTLGTLMLINALLLLVDGFIVIKDIILDTARRD